MSAKPVIEIKGLNKAYEIYARPLDLLKDKLFGGKRYDAFWALKDIDLEVREKQRVGIIGPNGAGKSTLLQIIAGNLQPSSGSVVVNGKISALLSLVPAWSTEETGVQNIEFNLLLRGCPPDAIPGLAEEIIDFTELGPFIYQPVKTYSAGMSARLSFAIATAVSPEILIIDEVLGAGDGYFANKAVQRMHEMCERGRALIFVSHSLAAVRQMCDTAIWLENGAIRMQGPVDRVAAAYEEDTIRRSEETEREGNRKRLLQTMQLVAPEEIEDHRTGRFRVRSEKSPSVRDTHFVSSLSVGADGIAGLPVSLDDATAHHEESGAWLDLSGCEWGRLYTRGGVNCRILAPRTGARKGGHFLAKRPAAAAAVPWNAEVRMLSTSLNHSEKLCVEFLNLATVKWEPMTIEARRDAEGGWEELICRAAIPAIDEAQRLRAVEMAKLDLRPPVQIEGIDLVVAGERASTVLEKQAFAIRIKLRYHKPMPETSVNLNITRSDGVYAFYQPSGLDGHGIENFVGEAEVDFTFEPNPFGTGEYHVNLFVCNAWSWENIPPSEIFDRSMGAFSFTVRNADPVTFGLINLRVPVAIRYLPLQAGS